MGADPVVCAVPRDARDGLAPGKCFSGLVRYGTGWRAVFCSRVDNRPRPRCQTRLAAGILPNRLPRMELSVPRRPTARIVPARSVPKPAEEEALVAACLAGDARAWKKLVQRYEGVMYAIPRRYGLGEEDAAEVFQNVCRALYRGLPRLKVAAGLTRWVVVTTQRQTRDVAVRRRREVPDVDEALGKARLDPAPLPDEVLEEMQSRVEIRAALECLNDRCAEILKCLYLEKEPLSYKEVALRLGIPEGTVGPTRARCLARLRQVMEKNRRRGIK
jgi:RNA polymerase sigma factor (sigma-70 family)